MMELAKPIENILTTTGASELTELFLWILAGTFIFSLFMKIIRQWSTFTNYTPTLLTSLGILGTFSGIISGLLVFDPKNIEGSIEGLLSGLQVAFITSLVGMTLSILYKMLTSISLYRTKGDTLIEDEIGIDDLYRVMKQQNDNLLNLQKVISDNNESSLVGQIKLMRSDTSDYHKVTNKHFESIATPLQEINKKIDKQQESFEQFSNTLWVKLQDFADMLSKSATEQVIQALKEVISDFNNKLTEQFGENFKQLNSAVGNLLQWQDNYKVQLGEMRSQFDQSVQAITETEKSVTNISNETKAIPENMNELKAVMEVNQHQISELARHLDAFKDVRDRAVEAIPEIREQIDQTLKGANEASAALTQGMNESIKKVQTAIVDSVEDFKSNVNKTNDALVESSEMMSKGMNESIGKVQMAIVTSAEDFQERVQQTNAALNTQSDILSKSSYEISEYLTATLSDLDKGVRIMLKDLSDNSKEVNEEFKKSGTSFINEFADVGSEFRNGLEKMSGDLRDNMENMSSEQVKQVQKVFDSLDSTISQTMQRTGESVKSQVDLIDEVLAKEIENVMNEMGRALARISSQFTNDYQKLVAEMSKITTYHRAS